MLDRDHTIGHSYLIDCQSISHLCKIFLHKVIPLLQECFYNDWEKIRLVLGQDLIFRESIKTKTTFGKNLDDFEDESFRYFINPDLVSGEIGAEAFFVFTQNAASQ